MQVTDKKLLTLSNLSFRFGEKPILHDISATINTGELWAVIGKNGTGKSTLIRCIARLLHSKKGAILLKGKELSSFRPVDLARMMSYVPQASARAMPPFTVSDYVMLGRFPYQGFLAIPSAEDRQIVLQSMELTDTITLKDRIMNTLSGGELQRVFLAGAVAQRTELLLLDEPASFLDPLHQELLLNALLRIHQEYNTTIITVTHDTNAALSRYTHILALLEGSTYFSGTSKDLLTKCPDALFDIYSLPFEKATAQSGREVIVPGVLHE